MMAARYQCAGCGAKKTGDRPATCAACGGRRFVLSAHKAATASHTDILEARKLGIAARRAVVKVRNPFCAGSAEAEAWSAGYTNDLDRWLELFADPAEGAA